MSSRSLPASSIDPDERVDNDLSSESLDIPQYPANMVAEPNATAVEFEDKMIKMVSITVKQIM
eukprot:7124605-Karenia_brevis.AAC.1